MNNTETVICKWTTTHVKQWLCVNGCEEYAVKIADEHQVDGTALLQLDENDLRQPPLSIGRLGDVKRIGAALRQLKSTAEAQTKQQLYSSAETNGAVGYAANLYRRCSRCIDSLDELSTFQNSNGHYRKRLSIVRDTSKSSLIKTFVAAVYCTLALLVTAFVMVIVHDRVPDMKMYPPLPDLILDNLPLIPWAFNVCEYIAMALSCIWTVVLITHKHRLIIMRRMFSLTGTVFLLRCVTMLITSLSVPGVHLECRAKSHDNMWEQWKEAIHIWSHLGMSIQGVRTCGDYMFSGHTTAVTLLNHFITEYTPDDWTQLHQTTWVANIFAIFFILAGHEHYSIDVFIAFYISSRLFLSYHAMAQQCLTATDDRVKTWFPFLWFFESGCPGRVPNEYEWPFPTWLGMRQRAIPIRQQITEWKNEICMYASTYSLSTHTSTTPRKEDGDKNHNLMQNHMNGVLKQRNARHNRK